MMDIHMNETPKKKKLIVNRYNLNEGHNNSLQGRNLVYII